MHPQTTSPPEPAYAELHCLSNFSFLRGAPHPEELVARAAQLGYTALAITDECSLAGVVRAHLEAKQRGLALIVGSEFRLQDGLHLVLLATDRQSYGRLAALITLARRQAKKGKYHLDRKQLEAHCPSGCIALWLPDQVPAGEDGVWLASLFPRRTWIAAELLLSGTDHQRLHQLQRLGERYRLALCASGDVHMHVRGRRALQDTLTAIRLGKPLTRLGEALYPNGERHLRARTRLQWLYPAGLLAESVKIARLCHFSLDELRYEYPRELVPQNRTPRSWLRHLVEQGQKRRWPEGTADKVRETIEHELNLIHELGYEPYFLTVYDLVRFAHRRGILCQGRGSAANSAVCYCLGITEVDPGHMNLLFERFISKERNEPPDIDVDFEHQRREEVIQYIYEKYGRERAALAATVITYQPRSAIRDVGKALGLDLEQIEHLAKSIQWWDGKRLQPQQLENAGLAPHHPVIRRLTSLVDELIGFPRHLSQHVGGFVIAQDRLSHLVPIENAAMSGRTVIQWEKNDLESLGLLKIDVLALGMLSAIRKALAYIGTNLARPLALADIPAEDSAVYDMLCEADTVGVFQIESRAQMSMLPRLRPRCYYDLVIQIAIVRPGPIQGDMVHPYLARRRGKQPVTYPSEAVRSVLERTLGVPIFQEQVMQLAMVAAGFSAGEADQLRRAMAAWKRRGGLEKFETRLMQGMAQCGYPETFARRIFKQIKGFGDYGFPESHSASFAHLAYVSAWLKRHHPAAFTCALLNSQPMGFYAPAQLVQDARRHGVEILPIDVRYSDRDCTLEAADETHRFFTPSPQPSPARGEGGVTRDSTQQKTSGRGIRPALRLGLRMVKGLSRAGIETLLQGRRERTFIDMQDLFSRGKMNRADLESLAAADALSGLTGHRHRAWWQVSGTQPSLPLLGVPHFPEAEPLLCKPSEGEQISADYASTGLSLRRHPLALLRERLTARGIRKASELWALSNGVLARAAGLVLVRQRPSSASGVIFVTLEDESGTVNVVVWPRFAQAQRRALLKATLLAVTGTLQRESNVLHLIAGRLEDLSPWLGELQSRSRDFH
ncbi:MAG: error-prone DNA polymerase [Pseudomonadota bacterium]